MKATFLVRLIVLALSLASFASVAGSALARTRVALGVAVVDASVAAESAMPALGRSTPNIIKLRAVLTARGELPPQEVKWPSAKGVFDATIDRTKQTITWRLTFSGASGHVFAAHIH